MYLKQNIPQICIQWFYIFTIGWSELSRKNALTFVLTAFITSILSICVALWNLYEANKFFQIKKTYTNCSICVISDSGEIDTNRNRLQLSVGGFGNIIAGIFQDKKIQPFDVEVYFPIEISQGLKIRFTIYSRENIQTIKLTPDEIYKRLTQFCQIQVGQTKLPQMIQEKWRLYNEVKIPQDKIEVEKRGNSIDEEERLLSVSN